MPVRSVFNGDLARSLTNGRRFVVTLWTTAGIVVIAGAGGRHVAAGLLVGGLLFALGLGGFIPGELMEIRRVDADERQRRLMILSTLAADYLVRLMLLVGVVSEVYRGKPGLFVIIAVVGTTAEIVSTLVVARTQ